MRDTGVYDRAFSEGSDARLAGVPRSLCPYRYGKGEIRAFWFQGWDDANMQFGSLAAGRWPVAPLPAVREVARA